MPLFWLDPLLGPISVVSCYLLFAADDAPAEKAVLSVGEIHGVRFGGYPSAPSCFDLEPWVLSLGHIPSSNNFFGIVRLAASMWKKCPMFGLLPFKSQMLWTDPSTLRNNRNNNPYWWFPLKGTICKEHLRFLGSEKNCPDRQVDEDEEGREWAENWPAFNFRAFLVFFWILK